MWPHTRDGQYSVKSGYHFIKQNRGAKQKANPSTSRTINSAVWNLIWSIPCPQKIKLFLWRACHNAIAVRENLYKRRLVDSPLCQICHKETETVEHALLLCPWSTPVWFGSQLQLSPNESNVQRLDSWIWQHVERWKAFPEDLQQRIGLMATLVWQVWKDGNESVFSHKNPDPVRTLRKATLTATEYLQVQLAERKYSSLPSGGHSRVHWRPPPTSMLKCNVDAAFSRPRQVGAISAIIRDNQGRVITRKAKKIHASSSLVAEAIALREGLILARSCYCERILIESDCSTNVERFQT